MDTTILIKTKKVLKNQAQELAQELGLSLTDVINASLRKFVINQGIVISKQPTDEYFNEKTRREMDKILKDIKEGKNLSSKFSSVDDAIAYLKS